MVFEPGKPPARAGGKSRGEGETSIARARAEVDALKRLQAGIADRRCVEFVKRGRDFFVLLLEH